MRYTDAKISLLLKFTSGNKIPVRRSTILKDEYEALKTRCEWTTLGCCLSIVMNIMFLTVIIWS